MVFEQSLSENSRETFRGFKPRVTKWDLSFREVTARDLKEGRPAAGGESEGMR